MANTAQLKMLSWGDDLRLPTFTDPEESASIVSQLNEYRSPSIPFQSKHLPSLKRNVWYALKRPDDRSRSGLLCVWPIKKCCIFVLGKKVAVIRLRVDSQLMCGGITLFVATLSPSSRKLWIEDTLSWKGQTLEHEPFSKRWSIAKQWIDNYVIPDSNLISGIELDIGKWGPLSTIQPDGSWDLMADDSRTRLYWRDLPSQTEQHIESVHPIEKKCPADKVMVDKISVEKAPVVAVAKRILGAGPDQWSLLSSDGISIGKALIRKMNVSALLRESSEPPCVEVSWNTDFNKWEIVSIHSGPASKSSFFGTPK